MMENLFNSLVIICSE